MREPYVGPSAVEMRREEEEDADFAETIFQEKWREYRKEYGEFLDGLLEEQKRREKLAVV